MEREAVASWQRWQRRRWWREELVARGVGEEEAERGWRKVLAVAETVRVEEREAVTREAVMERDGGEG